MVSKHYKRTIILVLSFFILALGYRLLFVASTGLERYTSYFVYPVLLAQHYITHPIKSLFEKRKTIHELQEKITTLNTEREILVQQNIELQSLINFAQDTQELAAFKQQYDASTATLAQVLVKQFGEQSHFFLIDKGTKSGVHKDMVVVYKNCLVGKVVEVYPCYSKVALITDNSCKVAAFCAQSKATGIYQGKNQEWDASLEHVSHLTHLEPGELVLSSGDGLVFPRGFGLGKIKSYHTTGLFYQVAIQPLIDLHAINYCYVIQKGAAIT